MKKSMIVMMMMVIVFSMNLFGEVVSEKVVDHVCTAECKHEEVKKECGPNCTKPCCADKAAVENHECTEKCELAKNHVCTDECKLDEKTETCELAALKVNCMSSVKPVESAKEQDCQPEGCKTKAVNKDCKK